MEDIRGKAAINKPLSKQHIFHTLTTWLQFSRTFTSFLSAIFLSFPLIKPTPRTPNSSIQHSSYGFWSISLLLHYHRRPTSPEFPPPPCFPAIASDSGSLSCLTRLPFSWSPVVSEKPRLLFWDFLSFRFLLSFGFSMALLFWLSGCWIWVLPFLDWVCIFVSSWIFSPLFVWWSRKFGMKENFEVILLFCSSCGVFFFLSSFLYQFWCLIEVISAKYERLQVCSVNQITPFWVFVWELRNFKRLTTGKFLIVKERITFLFGNWEMFKSSTTGIIFLCLGAEKGSKDEQ